MDSLQTVSKALAGALVTALVAYLSRHGFAVDQNLNDALTVIISAVIGFIGVYLAPRNTGN